MFSEFRVELQREFFEGRRYSYDEYIKIGTDHLDRMAQSFEKDMFACIAGETTRQIIIEDDWFPELKIDVFISHLWVNDEVYLAFAGWLYDTFGLNCMLDSYIWDNVERLIDQYNSMYSRRKSTNGNEVYDYGSGMRVSNHIISMLYMSAIKIMDKAEVFMSFNIDDDEYIFEDKAISRRYLPWIYTEAVMANSMKRKPLSGYRDKSWGKVVNDNDGKNEVKKSISGYELEQWELQYENDDRYPLDSLYKQLGIL